MYSIIIYNIQYTIITSVEKGREGENQNRISKNE